VLQVAVALFAIVPVGAGLAGILRGPAMVDALASTVAEDSHFRYLSGLLLAIGVAWWSVLPGIERHGTRIRLLAALVVSGGLARLASLIVTGIPAWPMLGALAMELAVTPAIAIWQARVARRMGAT
jgi:hypothetical protein